MVEKFGSGSKNLENGESTASVVLANMTPIIFLRDVTQDDAYYMVNESASIRGHKGNDPDRGYTATGEYGTVTNLVKDKDFRVLTEGQFDSDQVL